MERISSKSLKTAILLAGISVKAVAKSAGVSPVVISKFLNNDGAGIQLATLSKIARALKVNPMDLVFTEGE